MTDRDAVTLTTIWRHTSITR